MKKLFITIGLISAIYFFPLFIMSSHAFTLPGLRNELRNENQGDKNENKEGKKDLRNDLKNVNQQNKSTAARILGGTVTVISGLNLTVEKDGKSYTVQTDSNTKFRRHFWGSSSLGDISINDKVNVYGKFTDNTQLTILATLIRDTSIMKRFGAFIGTVSGLSGNTFTLNSVARGAQKVTLDSNTKCVNRKEVTISCTSDVQNGHRVRVKGMWDKTNSTITGVIHLKDYLLPSSVVTPTPTPTPTP